MSAESPGCGGTPPPMCEGRPPAVSERPTPRGDAGGGPGCRGASRRLPRRRALTRPLVNAAGPALPNCRFPLGARAVSGTDTSRGARAHARRRPQPGGAAAEPVLNTNGAVAWTGSGLADRHGTGRHRARRPPPGGGAVRAAYAATLRAASRGAPSAHRTAARARRTWRSTVRSVIRAARRSRGSRGRRPAASARRAGDERQGFTCVREARVGGGRTEQCDAARSTLNVSCPRTR
jgi:hypothetical protein